MSSRSVSNMSIRRGPRINFLVSLVLGFTLTTWSPFHLGPSETDRLHHRKRCQPLLEDTELPVTVNPPSLIFVGVVTTAEFVSTRAVAVNRTWAKTIPGRVTFFSGESSVTPAAKWNLPVVSLAGVDDSYPPMKKFYIMLKYMYDNHIDDYEWFMRADDDAYIKGDRLATFLRSINGTGRHFIGQGALGRPADRGRLHLADGENFCMGGTGMIFSRETLKSIGPHIRYCLQQDLWSHWDDVEVSRCVLKFAGVRCTWAHETEELFYQNYDGNLSYTDNLHTPELWKAITLHPFKQVPHMYRVHSYLQTRLIAEKSHQTLTQLREIRDMNKLLQGRNWTAIHGSFDHKGNRLGVHPDLMKLGATSAEDVIPWKMFEYSLYTHNNSPKGRITKLLRAAIDEVVLQAMQYLKSDSEDKKQKIVLEKVMHGYSRVTSPYGVDYLLNLRLRYHSYTSSFKPRSARRNVYLTQVFGGIQFIEDELLMGEEETRLTHGRDHNEHPPSTRESARWDSLSGTPSDTVHFILPLSGRLEIFSRFMETFENNFIVPAESVALSVVLFRSRKNDTSEEIESALDEFRNKHPSNDIRLIRGVGDFRRAMALNLGASQYPGDALLFFVDVDMYVSRDFLLRCRRNSLLGSRVYYPSVFSQYNPDFFRDRRKQNDKFTIDKETGRFNDFGFGMVCLYNSDLQRVGGMNSSIVGWGHEDLDLLMKISPSNITVFRAPDTGLVHIYHPAKCDKTLDHQKYQMCLGSKSEKYGSNVQLAEHLQRVRDAKNVSNGSIEETIEEARKADPPRKKRQRHDLVLMK